ncbi:MAG: hypothetical protein F2663_06825 [Actinobacteria bacterium]|uniref:4-(cytidine 5'-diphospho)-2-C-methyl-D-erythritol kinase n=1 Tax=freshwater metagenome TaxID=449393 RepID=A0A6J6PWR9_9ZZZZ|nr:hypothetical protein [Actinomycetota bacterium]
MTTVEAYAKLNLALVVGVAGADGYHELWTLFQRISLSDTITLEAADDLEVVGFADDTLVARALEAVATEAAVAPRWRVTIDKRIPVAAGLGGGSADAAAALQLASATLPNPLPPATLHRLARTLGADVPFFLQQGPCVGTGDGSVLEPVELPQGYTIVLALPHDEVKESTGAVYRRFDERNGGDGFAERRAAAEQVLRTMRSPEDLGALPPNDLAQSPLAAELRAAGAFHADASGAGPAVFGLFLHAGEAATVAASIETRAQVWLCEPAW